MDGDLDDLLLRARANLDKALALHQRTVTIHRWTVVIYACAVGLLAASVARTWWTW